MSQEQTERQSQRELFWLDDPAHFFVRWHKFLPTNDMTVPEALNAVVRFTVYSALLVAIVARRTDYLLLIPLVMLASVFLVRLFPKTQMIQETFNNLKRSAKTGGAEHFSTPSADNPFMNVLFTDYVDDPARVSAPPDVTSSVLDSSIREAFSKTSDLFMDTSDTYGLMESSRNWVTQAATTIPNDLEGFQSFLNKDNVSRKGKSEEYVLAEGSTMNPIPTH
uniref:Minor capsid protein P9 transmembrane helices domain-containing protein n=1 Tax=viral metagenome TaxID=1070528 RepID=A0A6C0HLH3_9ZZZZ